MKHLLLLATLLISGATFAQDTVTLVLSKVQRRGTDDGPKPIFARVEVSEEIFNLTTSKRGIELVCKYSKDADLKLALGIGLVYARHKSFLDNKPVLCEYCGFQRFRDLLYKDARAKVQPLIDDKLINYTIESANSWQKLRDLRGIELGMAHWQLELEDIPVIEIYSPKKHKKTMPMANDFSCVLVDHQNRKLIDP